MGRTCCVQKLFCTFRTISVHNMSSPCSAKRRASDKDLPVNFFNPLWKQTLDSRLSASHVWLSFGMITRCSLARTRTRFWLELDFQMAHWAHNFFIKLLLIYYQSKSSTYWYSSSKICNLGIIIGTCLPSIHCKLWAIWKL